MPTIQTHVRHDGRTMTRARQPAKQASTARHSRRCTAAWLATSLVSLAGSARAEGQSKFGDKKMTNKEVFAQLDEFDRMVASGGLPSVEGTTFVEKKEQEGGPKKNEK